MDISGGLWLCYWFPGEDRKADGRFVEMTEKVAGSHWYECTFNETTNATFNHVFINESAWSSTSQYTWASGWSTANSICEELFYKYDGWSSWDAYTADCDAKDHNYTIKSVVADASKAGRVTLTITPEKQQAPRYDIEYRQYGMGESFSWLGRCEGATTFSAAFDFKVDRKYEFSVTPYDDNYNLMAASATCMAEITGNPNIPTDLKATVGADEQTVTFEWKKVGTETAYFGIKAYDYMVGTLRMDATKITEEKYVAKFPIPVGYSWTLTAYNASGEVLASVDGPDFTTNGPDLAPSNLNVAVNGKKATLAWKAPLAASFCGYLIEDSYTGDVIASGHVSGKNGQYSVTYSLDKDTTMMFAWYVISESAGKEPISVPMFGSTFTITGSKEDPTPGKQYTLNISAEAGGSVNDAVNGKWDEGAKVTIYAYPDWMWEFDEWSDGDKNATRKLIMDKDYTLVAKFKTTATFTLTISAGEHGKVNEEVNGTYTGGEKVTIKATPDKGYKFEMWSDGDTHATREITMTENLNLKASFVTIKYYTLEVDIDPGDEAGIILFNGTEESGNSVKVQEGTTVTLKAKANSGYTFKQFEDGGTKITSSEYDVVVTSNTTVTAVFSKNSSHAIENITVDGESATKVFHEGQIYIIREGNVYTPTGMKVK